jgi:hypothetical protein
MHSRLFLGRHPARITPHLEIETATNTERQCSLCEDIEGISSRRCVLSTVKIDLAKVMDNTDNEQSTSLLSGIWHSRNSRPSRKTLWWFAALAVVLQSLLIFKWYFYDQDIVQGPSYDVNETVELITAVSLIYPMSFPLCARETQSHLQDNELTRGLSITNCFAICGTLVQTQSHTHLTLETKQ